MREKPQKLKKLEEGEILKREGRGFGEKIEWNCSTWNKV